MTKQIFKLFVSLFAKIIGKSERAVRYMLSEPLKHQAADFYENIYNRGDAHITNTIKNAAASSNPNKVILDIGGFVGTTVKVFADECPNNHIYVFEPLPENIQQLELIAQNYKNITIVPKAVGETNGKNFINKSANTASSSIFPLIADSHSQIFRDVLVNKGRLEIDIISLDDFLPTNVNVSIMKLDVQGYELNALKGAKNTLKNTDFIIIEVSNHDYYKGGAKYFEIDQFLREHNFVLSDIYPSLKDNNILKEWDCIYVSKRIYDSWHS